jgi:hypothetical protein
VRCADHGGRHLTSAAHRFVAFCDFAHFPIQGFAQMLKSYSREDSVYLATHSPAQTIFGGSYVPEQYGDPTHRFLPAAEPHEHVMDFDAILKVLRAALSLR